MSGRVLYYALGGGLGHLTRAGAFLQQFGLAERALILGASSYLDDPRVSAGIATCSVPEQLQHSPLELKHWLMQCIECEQPALICIDSFPAGILGELCDFPALDSIPLWHVARLLRWSTYAPLMRGRAPRYARSWRLEPLHSPHQAFLEAHSEEIVDLALAPCAVTGQAMAEREADDEIAIEQPFWLVLHSGPAAEVAELLAYADDMRRLEEASVPIVVCSLQPPSALPSHCRVINRYPAGELIDRAERIVSAAGFNLMRDTHAVRQRQHILPFPRRFDDQFERARRVRSGSA